MGVVYEAEQESLGLHVALKLLPSSALLNATYLERFRREAKAAGRLHHTNIVPVFGVGECNGIPFYVMQFIQGEGLDKVLVDVRRLRQRPGAADAAPVSEGSVAHGLLTGHFAPPTAIAPSLSHEKTSSLSASSATSRLSMGGPEADYYRGVARVGIQAADALAYAHAQGILHRDVKPSNLLLELRGTVWITDFGLAKAEGTEELTHTGDIVGTIRFMAPERFQGKSLPQSDIYGLGLTLYELLTLQAAFDDTNKGRLIDKVLHEQPVPPRKIDPRIPRDLETIVLKCLAKEPKYRYAAAELVAEDLRRFLADRPIQARRATAAERAWRWCRRNPVIAGLGAAFLILLTATAIGGIAMSLSLSLALSQTQEAEREQKRQVYQGHVTEAKYRRYSRRQGQRFESLQAIRKALRLLPDLDLSQQENQKQRQLLRDLAISCLTLPDVQIIKHWEGWPERSDSVDLDERGELYARSDRQGHVSVRRVADDQEVLHIAGDGKPVGTFSFMRDGMLLIWRSGRWEAWHAGRARPEFAFSASGPPRAFRATRDLRTMASLMLDGTVTLYDLPDGGVRRREKLARADAWDDYWLEFSPNGKYLAVMCGPYQSSLALARMGSREPPAARSVVRIYDVYSRQPPLELRHADVIASLAWYPDSTTIATGCTNSNAIYVWDVPSRRKLAEITSQKGGAPWLTVNRSGDFLASVSTWAGGVRLWHAQTGQELLTLPESRDFFFVQAPDGRLFSRRPEGTTFRITECVPGQVRRSFVRDLRAEKGKQYKTPAMHPDGRLLAVSMETGVGLWDLPGGRELAFLPIGDTETAAFDSAGALWTYGHKGMLRWPIDVIAGSPATYRVGPPQTLFAKPTFNVKMAVSDNGKVAAAALAAQDSLVIHVGVPLRAVRLPHESDVRQLAVSPDGPYVATAPPWNAKKNGYRVWDSSTGKLLQTLLPHEQGSKVGFTPDGRWLIIGGRWFEAGTWREGRGIDGWSLGSISHDGKLLACDEVDGIGLFDRTSGRRLAQLSGPAQGRIWEMAFDRDGSHLIATDKDSLMIIVWDLRKLRAELSNLSLDWEAPPYPPRLGEEDTIPESPRVQIEMEPARKEQTR